MLKAEEEAKKAGQEAKKQEIIKKYGPESGNAFLEFRIKKGMTLECVKEMCDYHRARLNHQVTWDAESSKYHIHYAGRYGGYNRDIGMTVYFYKDKVSSFIEY